MSGQLPRYQRGFNSKMRNTFVSSPDRDPRDSRPPSKLVSPKKAGARAGQGTAVTGQGSSNGGQGPAGAGQDSVTGWGSGAVSGVQGPTGRGKGAFSGGRGSFSGRRGSFRGGRGSFRGRRESVGSKGDSWYKNKSFGGNKKINSGLFTGKSRMSGGKWKHDMFEQQQKQQQNQNQNQQQRINQPQNNGEGNKP